MERYFKIKCGSVVENTLNKYETDLKTWRVMVDKFIHDFDIESTQIYISDALGIHAMTQKDREKYEKQVKADGEWFKKTSALYKEYQKRMRENGLENTKFRLIVWDLGIYDICGKHSIYSFKHNDMWYIRIVSECDYNYPSDKLEEIKASEFYSISEKSKFYKEVCHATNRT